MAILLLSVEYSDAWFCALQVDGSRSTASALEGGGNAQGPRHISGREFDSIFNFPWYAFSHSRTKECE